MLGGTVARTYVLAALTGLACACGGGVDFPATPPGSATETPATAPVCGSWTLTSGQQVWGLQLAVAAGQVFYTAYGAGADGHDHQLWSVPTGGGEPSLIWQGPSGILGSGVVIADGQAYVSSELAWNTGQEGVLTVPLGGGPASTAARFATPCAAYGGMAMDDANVYAGSNGCSLGAGQIVAVPRAGGAATTVWSGDEPGVGAAAVAMHAGELYFLLDDDGDGDGNLMNVTPGAAARPVATGIAREAHGIAADDVGVYLTSEDSLYLLADDAAHPVVLASGLHHAGLVAVDASGIYVVEGNAWEGEIATVLRVSHDGGPPAVIAAGQKPIFALALDDSAVYWASQAGQTVTRVGKCGAGP